MLAQFPQKFGAYVLLGPLGEGGMGAVYLAMSGHREMETLCVVKRLLPALQSQPEQVLRFRREADLARRLVHGNLAHTHNIGEVDGEVFLVQEFVEGHDVSALLEELRARQQTLPVALAVHVASEIARGLAYAHAFEHLDLVHRDINPPNIRVTYSGEVKLLDFGIASTNLHGDARSDHRGAGKLWHLAPEQVRPGGVPDRRTDIYALGVVLWELLTQQPVGTTRTPEGDVCQAETEGEVLVWLSRAQHQRPSVFNPSVPAELDALVAKATHADRDLRFADADELRAALAPFIPAGFPAERRLAGLMEEMFSPDRERTERRHLVEEGRHLLATGPGQRRQGRRASDARADTPEVPRPGWHRRHVLAGIGLVALGGMLAWALLGRGKGAAGPPATAADALPTSPPARSSAPRALGPAEPSLHPPPSLVPPPAASSTARSMEGAVPDARPAHAAVSTKHPDAAPAPASAPAKADHLHLARDAFNARDWSRALSEGKLAVAAGGGADAHALMGNTYFKMGRFADAETAYAKAVALDPDNPLLQERRGLAHVRAQEQKSGKEN